MSYKTASSSTGNDIASKSIKDFLGKNRGRAVFLEHEVKGLLKEMGFSVPNGRFFGRGEATTPLPDLAFPLVAKVASSKITSKSNVGGVRIGIANEDQLNRAVQELSRIEHAEGILVEEMAPEGVEVIVGGVIDNQFGPIVMFGLGGVFVELFKDVAFGLAPLKAGDVLWLIQQIKGYRLLEGYRGKPPVDRDALIKIIVTVSEIMATGLVREIDLNPVTLYPEGFMILDAKMVVIS